MLSVIAGYDGDKDPRRPVGVATRDDAVERCDVLVMSTVPITSSWATSIGRALETNASRSASAAHVAITSWDTFAS